MNGTFLPTTLAIGIEAWEATAQGHYPLRGLTDWSFSEHVTGQLLDLYPASGGSIHCGCTGVL